MLASWFILGARPFKMCFELYTLSKLKFKVFRSSRKKLQAKSASADLNHNRKLHISLFLKCHPYHNQCVSSLGQLQVAVRTTIDLDKEFKNDKELFDDLKQVLKTANKGFTDAIGNALHRLKKIKPSIDAFKELVEGIP